MPAAETAEKNVVMDVSDARGEACFSDIDLSHIRESITQIEHGDVVVFSSIEEMDRLARKSV